MRPAEIISYLVPSVLYARYRCIDCECEWDDPIEKPGTSLTLYRVKFDGNQTEVMRNGVLLPGLQSFTAKASIDSPTVVTLTEIAEVEPL